MIVRNALGWKDPKMSGMIRALVSGGDTSEGIDERHGGSREERCDVMPRTRTKEGFAKPAQTSSKTWLEPNRHLSELVECSTKTQLIVRGFGPVALEST
jgi:hypothetical protein